MCLFYTKDYVVDPLSFSQVTIDFVSILGGNLDLFVNNQIILPPSW